MFNLDIESLLSEQALGDNFDIWFPPSRQKGIPKNKKTIRSETHEDVQEGVKAYRKGASLYFSANVGFRDSYC